MIKPPRELWDAYYKWLGTAGVPRCEQPPYRKWLRYYLDFCHKYGHAYVSEESIPHFQAKLASKGQDEGRCAQAGVAVRLYQQMVAAHRPCGAWAATAPPVPTSAPRAVPPGPGSAPGVETAHGWESLTAAAPAPASGLHVPEPRTAQRPGAFAAPNAHRTEAASPGDAREPDGPASWQRAREAMEGQVRLRNYSPKTLRTYWGWASKFRSYVRGKPTSELTTEDVKAFLTDLAVRRHVAASTQNQAFNALLFLFRHGLGREFGKVDGVVRAKRRPYIPVVLSRREVDIVIGLLSAPYDLLVKLLYGCGLRISEALELRVHCFNLDEAILTVHDGKGQKDRTVPLPEIIVPELHARLAELRALHGQDLATGGFAGVFLPRRLEQKWKNAPKEFVWQWFFPAPRLTRVKGSDELRRYHLQRSDAHRAIKSAVSQAALTKRVTAHTFRHSFASHLLQAGYDICTIQKLLGHSDVKTTMIYTQTVPSITLKEAKSPLDL